MARDKADIAGKTRRSSDGMVSNISQKAARNVQRLRGIA